MYKSTSVNSVTLDYCDQIKLTFPGIFNSATASFPDTMKESG